MAYWGEQEPAMHRTDKGQKQDGLEIKTKLTCYTGYKFETLSCLPRPWGEVSREFIENRDREVVSNKAQYCSVVRTGIGSTVMCLGGEVDACKLSRSPWD